MTHRRACLVIDLEATCDDGNRVPREEMEIIEIGAVLVDMDSGEAFSEFQSFVNPLRHPKLTPFCTKLTTITQAQVESARAFPYVYWAMLAWVRSKCPSGLECWGSWGAYDAKQFAQDLDYHAQRDQLPRHINIKKLFRKTMGLSKPCGVMKAMGHVGLEFEGTLHRGIDDARAIAKLLPFALGLKTKDD